MSGNIVSNSPAMKRRAFIGIAIAIVVGGILLVAFLIIATLISVPAVVFFPAYAIHFFAERYPALSSVLNPPSTVPET